MCTVLKKMNYTIKTNFGPTEAYSAKDARIFGTGQGAGWSPPRWAANSDIISCVMERYSPGMLIQHPNLTLESNRHIDAFVDDSSIGITDTAYTNFHPRPGDPVSKGRDLYQQTQFNTQFYCRLMFTTGGLLAIHKCVAYILLYVWVNGKRKLEPVKTKYGPIEVKQGIDLA